MGKRRLIGSEKVIDGKIYHLYVTTQKGTAPYHKEKLKAEGWSVRLVPTYTQKSGQKYVMVFRRKK
jgi:hypothetical protein